jgi:hypothetical protein
MIVPCAPWTLETQLSWRVLRKSCALGATDAQVETRGPAERRGGGVCPWSFLSAPTDIQRGLSDVHRLRRF